VATYTLFDDVSRRNDTQHRSRSRQLEEFRRGDWSTMATELANVISNDAPIQLRHVPVVPGVCDVMATMYVRRPDREFSGKQLATLEAESLWRRAGAERALRRAEHALTAQQSQYILVDPLPGGGVRLTVLDPYEVEVSLGADPLATSLDEAESVAVRVPIYADGCQVQYGRRTYERQDDGSWRVEASHATASTGGPRRASSAVYRDEAGEALASMPFDRLPIVSIRAIDPPRGLWVPDISEDLRSIQIGTTIALSDIENICRAQCYGDRVLYGPGATVAARTMEHGPNNLMVFDSGGESGLSYQLVNSNPAVQKYIDALERTLTLFERFRHLPAGTVSQGITGDAKAVDREELEMVRERRRALWEEAETDLAQTIAMVAGVDGWDTLSVRVEHRPLAPRRNDLQVAQATALNAALGLVDPVKLRAEADGISREEAAERAERDIAYTLDRLRNGAPGVDSIASSVATMAAEREGLS
jgi:hypothetical protein